MISVISGKIPVNSCPVNSASCSDNTPTLHVYVFGSNSDHIVKAYIVGDSGGPGSLCRFGPRSLFTSRTWDVKAPLDFDEPITSHDKGKCFFLASGVFYIVLLLF